MRYLLYRVLLWRKASRFANGLLLTGLWVVHLIGLVHALDTVCEAISRWVSINGDLQPSIARLVRFCVVRQVDNLIHKKRRCLTKSRLRKIATKASRTLDFPEPLRPTIYDGHQVIFIEIHLHVFQVLNRERNMQFIDFHGLS